MQLREQRGGQWASEELRDLRRTCDKGNLVNFSLESQRVWPRDSVPIMVIPRPSSKLFTDLLTPPFAEFQSILRVS